jgi:hypothetical protein
MILNQVGMGPYQGQLGMFAQPNPFGGMGPFVPQAPTKNNNSAPSPIKCLPIRTLASLVVLMWLKAVPLPHAPSIDTNLTIRLGTLVRMLHRMWHMG